MIRERVEAALFNTPCMHPVKPSKPSHLAS
jgi:hypothetical protein